MAPGHQVEARFDCYSTSKQHDGANTTVKLFACTDEEACADFTDSTPCGDIEFDITDGFPAEEFFEEGKTYRVIFEEVDEE